MANGQQNYLTGQVGEYLVCSELARQGLIATPFAGNVPIFDVLVTDSNCRTLPIQVKTIRQGHWQVSDVRKWMDINSDPISGRQEFVGAIEIPNPDLIYVNVFLSEAGLGHDRFFILTKSELQQILIHNHSSYLQRCGGIRTRNPNSFHCDYRVENLLDFENRWKLIADRLSD